MLLTIGALLVQVATANSAPFNEALAVRAAVAPMLKPKPKLSPLVTI